MLIYCSIFSLRYFSSRSDQFDPQALHVQLGVKMSSSFDFVSFASEQALPLSSPDIEEVCVSFRRVLRCLCMYFCVYCLNFVFALCNFVIWLCFWRLCAHCFRIMRCTHTHTQESYSSSPEHSSDSASHSSASPLRDRDEGDHDMQQQTAHAHAHAHAQQPAQQQQQQPIAKTEGQGPPAPQPILLGTHESHAAFEPCVHVCVAAADTDTEGCDVCSAPEILLTENRKVSLRFDVVCALVCVYLLCVLIGDC